MDDDPFENLEGGIKKINVYDFLLGKKSYNLRNTIFGGILSNI